MIAPLDEALARDREVGAGFLELFARLAIAQRDGDRLEVSPVVGLGARVGEAVEVVDRLLLRLGPQALAADIGPDGRQDRNAGRPQQHEQHDDGDERPHDPQQPQDVGEQAVEPLHVRVVRPSL